MNHHSMTTTAISLTQNQNDVIIVAPSTIDKMPPSKHDSVVFIQKALFLSCGILIIEFTTEWNWQVFVNVWLTFFVLHSNKLPYESLEWVDN